ncbi:MAG: putative molybdenum carrier protein [Elusimicrobia bacterium]|nr:putative molybdenum carrier protein [Elusimicrobiota bacterium]
MIKKIISGGQTGVDRAALDVAIELGIPHGGFCPRGRKAEDGRIPDRYVLTETDSEDYAVRTERNVDASDGTLILFFGEMSGGTLITNELCQVKRKPVFVVDLMALSPETPWAFRTWFQTNGIRVLNVAGPRASQTPAIYSKAKTLLTHLFTAIRQP